MTALEPEFDLSTKSHPREEEKDLKLYFLAVEIINATDLIADLVGLSRDPFVTVTANNQTHETQVIKDNLNPEFNEKKSFCFFHEVTELYFQVWDWDKNKEHDEIGKYMLDISNFFLNLIIQVLKVQ